MAVYQPLTPKQINRQANRQTAAAMAAARAPILSAYGLAQARQKAGLAALSGFGTAAAGLMAPIGPKIQAGYDQAAHETAGLASGFSGAAADRVKAQVAQDQQVVDQQAPGAAPLADQNPENLHNTLYDLAGFIPGAKLEDQAAAANRWGSELPAIQASKTSGDILQQNAQNTQEDQQYVQNLLDLAAKEPALRQQILSQIYSNEATRQNLALKEQAQALLGAKFGEQQRVDNARIRQGNVKLQLQAEGLAIRQQSQNLAVKKFLQQGGTIDPSASRAAGYLVRGDGQPLLDKSGKRIPVAASSAGKSTGPGSTSYKDAYKYAAQNYVVQYLSPGVPDPTQTRPPFVQMQAHLVNAYGVSKAQARKILVGLGIKPDGKRP